MWSPEREQRLRAAAMGWLEVRTQDGSIPLTSEEIREFAYEGERFALMDPQRGIRSLRGLSRRLSLIHI